MKDKLNTDQMIEKLEVLYSYTEKILANNIFIERLGAVTIYAGITDFYTIQSARLLEQIILKAQLLKGDGPSFEPKEDEYFFDNQLKTRNIIKEIKRMLSLKHLDSSNPEEENLKISEITKDYSKKTLKFLDYRNTIMHHIASPKKSIKEIEELIDKAIKAFKDMEASHKIFCETLAPYRFSDNEIDYFYNKNTQSKK
jgi:hypothetical protein